MAKTLATIQQQIEKLQEQANALKKKEAVGVIARIKTAIDAYGLTTEDLFGDAPATTSKPAAKTRKNAAAPKPVKAGRKNAAAKKAPKPPKFTNGTSFWSGHGKRPQWYKDAIDSGKTQADLAVKPA
ncbi:MAG: hypothetical protein JWP29_3178 [Rhodoferax sp.]|nr:hypothetical protein [Rhodoferax sp.]